MKEPVQWRAVRALAPSSGYAVVPSISSSTAAKSSTRSSLITIFASLTRALTMM